MSGGGGGGGGDKSRSLIFLLHRMLFAFFGQTLPSCPFSSLLRQLRPNSYGPIWPFIRNEIEEFRFCFWLKRHWKSQEKRRKMRIVEDTHPRGVKRGGLAALLFVFKKQKRGAHELLFHQAPVNGPKLKRIEGGGGKNEKAIRCSPEMKKKTSNGGCPYPTVEIEWKQKTGASTNAPPVFFSVSASPNGIMQIKDVSPLQ